MRRSKWAIGFSIAVLLGAVALLVLGYQADSSVAKQVGASGLVVGLAALALSVASPGARRTMLRAALGAGVWIGVFFLSGEALLRIVYWEGESFSSRTGPLVRRFERDFVLNRYAGPSRGPEIPADVSPDSLRLLVQGDSITWGQGVKDEDDLYSARVLSELRAANARADMAVLAYPGREIDGHVAQLRALAGTLMPDVIVYQWHPNDMELDKSSRPGTNWFWRRTFIHRFLVQRSYLWFFLDYNIDLLSWTDEDTYGRYLLEHYSPDSAAWNAFGELFGQWCSLATQATPRVLVVLYPRMALSPGSPPALLPGGEILARQVETLCPDVEYLDLAPVFAQVPDAEELLATRFDSHPSAAAHALIADAIVRSMRRLWPETQE